MMKSVIIAIIAKIAIINLKISFPVTGDGPKTCKG